MRRILIATSICISLLNSDVEAQLINCIGLKLGSVAANQDWEYSRYTANLDTRVRWGTDLGAYVEWLHLPVVSLLTEVHYIQKGFRVDIPVRTTANPEGDGTFHTYAPRVDYLAIPLLAKCRIELGSSSLYVFGGPRLDVFLNTDDQGFGIVLDNFRYSEYGVTIGLGFLTTQILPFGLGAEIRYSPSLQDSYATDLLTVRNSSFEIVLVISN